MSPPPPVCLFRFGFNPTDLLSSLFLLFSRSPFISLSPLSLRRAVAARKQTIEASDREPGSEPSAAFSTRPPLLHKAQSLPGIVPTYLPPSLPLTHSITHSIPPSRVTLSESTPFSILERCPLGYLRLRARSLQESSHHPHAQCTAPPLSVFSLLSITPLPRSWPVT